MGVLAWMRVFLHGRRVPWGQTWKRSLRRGRLVTGVGGRRSWDGGFLQSAGAWGETNEKPRGFRRELKADFTSVTIVSHRQGAPTERGPPTIANDNTKAP